MKEMRSIAETYNSEYIGDGSSSILVKFLYGRRNRRGVVCDRILFFCALFSVAAITACTPVSQVPQIDPSLAAAEAAKQEDAALRKSFDMRKRFTNVEWHVLRSNIDACPDDVGYAIGVDMATLADANGQMESAWRRAGVDETPTILSVVPDAPADKAGIVAGDKVVAVNGVDVSGNRWAVADAYEEINDDDDGVVDFTIKRNYEKIIITTHAEPTCSYAAAVFPERTVNAYADGKQIIFTSGMMDFIQNDNELALVFGHEMAHNTMGHHDKKLGNRAVGAFFGALVQVLLGVPGVAEIGADAGQGAYSQEFEAEADYVGVYYAARAGYDVDGVAALWRRMATDNPQAIGLQGTSHPSTATRYLAVEAAAKEIAEKRAAGQALVPNMKSDDS